MMSPEQHYAEAERLTAALVELNAKLGGSGSQLAVSAAQIQQAFPAMIAFAQLHYVAAMVPPGVVELARWEP